MWIVKIWVLLLEENSFFLKNPLQDLLSILNAVISTNHSTWFEAGHMIYGMLIVFKSYRWQPPNTDIHCNSCFDPKSALWKQKFQIVSLLYRKSNQYLFFPWMHEKIIFISLLHWQPNVPKQKQNKYCMFEFYSTWAI